MMNANRNTFESILIEDFMCEMQIKFKKMERIHETGNFGSQLQTENVII